MKKQRNQLLKMKAKAMGGNTTGEPRILFDIDEQNTFITGGGVPGKKKKFQDEDRPMEKIYDNEEDKLLDDVDKMDDDMQKMMEYLNEVESMMGGSDLDSIRKMMKCTDKSVD